MIVFRLLFTFYTRTLVCTCQWHVSHAQYGCAMQYKGITL